MINTIQLTMLVAATFAPTAVAVSDSPNVVFFLVDDLGWADLGCYGSSFHETPSADRLASEGVRFTDAYAACHVCSPTRASVMTGRYPARIGLTDWIPGRRDFPFQKLTNAPNLQQLPLEQVTLPEALQSHGYATGHFGKWHLGEDEFGPLHQGFDVQVPKNWYKGWPRAGYHAPFKLDALADQPGDYLTDRLTDEALRFIEDYRDQPFFLYLSHFAVHDPIHGRGDLVEKYRRKLEERQATDETQFILEANPDDAEPLTREALDELIQQPSHSPFRVLPQRTVKIKQRQDNVEFAAMVEAMDESLGRVLNKLEELGLDENTIVIFTSDNGGMAGMNVGNPLRQASPDKLDTVYSTANLPLRGAKGWLYEGGIRVPAIIKWPGKAEAGVVCGEPIISNDFYPTILQMADLPPRSEQTTDGVSLVPALQGGSLERDALYWHFPHYSNHGMQSPGGAIRQGDFKLLEYFENNTVQLFNLAQDIGEQHDLAKQQPAKAKKLRNKLHAWRKQVGANGMEPNPDYNSAEYPFVTNRIQRR
ncbi:Arylsulfatase [Stieleria maiorica]|uniref:Arylsulfatase n=1 Tax=Stieleria maiorica TaxID=2795974 RepID=A0A5B9MAQ2_9BACT|nr:sulfatase [Stieleria maiorica]QEF96624.1 Arylsulfatase [Stieleria maiorica]